MEHQIYLNDEQKNYLLEYMRGQRTTSIFCMCVMFLMSIIAAGFLFIPDIATEKLNLTFYPSPILLIFLIFCLFNFISDLRKIFILTSDIYNIANNLYSLSCSELEFNKKHSHDLKYQISDNDGNIYICPKYTDYRENKFIYIKLENGRNYAIADN